MIDRGGMSICGHEGHSFFSQEGGSLWGEDDLALRLLSLSLRSRIATSVRAVIARRNSRHMHPLAFAFLALCIPCNMAALASRAATLPRRSALLGASSVIFTGAMPGSARTPGSSDVGEAIEQIVDGTAALKQLRANWAKYACIDKEGRACNIDAARKILGGVAPQRGDAAIAVAKQTPLYRIDGAFAAIRKFALDASDDSWGSRLEVETFVEKADNIVFQLKRVDDSFYGVVFASKGSTMLEKKSD